jgi:hypothetical protein
MFNQNGLRVSVLTNISLGLALGLALGLTLINVQPSHAQGLGSELSRLGQVFGHNNNNNNVNNNLNYDRGQLGGNYGTLRAEQNGIQQQAQAEARANGGYLTGQQQGQIRAEENGVRQQMSQDYQGQGGAFGHGRHNGGGNFNGGAGGFGGGAYGNNGYGNSGFNQSGFGNGMGFGNGNFATNHPGRAEVLGRDNNINRELNADRGQLGGNYQGLKAEDRAIKQQERSESRANGGYLTGSQQQQLNQEENMLQNQVRQDRHY